MSCAFLTWLLPCKHSKVHPARSFFGSVIKDVIFRPFGSGKEPIMIVR